MSDQRAINYDLESIQDQLIQQRAFVISAEQAHALAPAVLGIYEWQSYWLHLPGIDKLQVGSSVAYPEHGDWFQVRFENQLGLAQLQPITGVRTVGPAMTIEVISPKFPNPIAHYQFFKSLLEDLYQKAVRLPFTIESKTERNVLESLRPPTPLFTYYFLRQFASHLESALEVILVAPHRLLVDEEDFVHPALVKSIDAEVLLDILHTPERWVKAENHPVAEKLGGYAPDRVLQRLSQETLDTPENQFILYFLKQLLNAADDLFAQPWWKYVPAVHCKNILKIQSVLQQAIQHPTFAEVGEQHLLPLHSQVLLRRDGYRQMLGLWLKFQQARRPLFEPLERAIALRSVDQLYEYWTFFALSEQIGDLLGICPVIEMRTSDEHGLIWQSQAVFGKSYRLIYNQKFAPKYITNHSYSVTLRPDFAWVINGKTEVVLDAKFRLTLDGFDEETATSTASPVLDDLYKMHTYRDALQVRSAVSVYPGTREIFYDRICGRFNKFDLLNILLYDHEGIGALPLKPEYLPL